MPADAIQWYKENLEHNTPGGKLNRGLSVVDTFEILTCKDKDGNKTREMTEEEYKKAAILGWCVELVSKMERGVWQKGIDSYSWTRRSEMTAVVG